MSLHASYLSLLISELTAFRIFLFRPSCFLKLFQTLQTVLGHLWTTSGYKGKFLSLVLTSILGYKPFNLLLRGTRHKTNIRGNKPSPWNTPLFILLFNTTSLFTLNLKFHFKIIDFRKLVIQGNIPNVSIHFRRYFWQTESNAFYSQTWYFWF